MHDNGSRLLLALFTARSKTYLESRPFARRMLPSIDQLEITAWPTVHETLVQGDG